MTEVTEFVRIHFLRYILPGTANTDDYLPVVVLYLGNHSQQGTSAE